MALGFTDTRSIVDVKLVCTLVSIIRVGLLVRKYSNTHTTSLTPYSKIFQTEERMHWTHYFMRRWCLVHTSSLNKHVYACTKPGKRTFMYLCARGLNIALFCDFSMWFWDRSDREVYFFFHFVTHTHVILQTLLQFQWLCTDYILRVCYFKTSSVMIRKL